MQTTAATKSAPGFAAWSARAITHCTAVMIAAIMVHGILPGPMLIQQQPDLFWGFVASMYVGNIMLLSNFISEYLIGAIQGTIIIIAMLVQRSLARKA